jgi:FKBP-type peptidyl-prolyl cis-trans isomerase
VGEEVKKKKKEEKEKTKEKKKEEKTKEKKKEKNNKKNNNKKKKTNSKGIIVLTRESNRRLGRGPPIRTSEAVPGSTKGLLSCLSKCGDDAQDGRGSIAFV